MNSATLRSMKCLFEGGLFHYTIYLPTTLSISLNDSIDIYRLNMLNFSSSQQRATRNDENRGTLL